jgi:hypothetical protein
VSWRPKTHAPKTRTSVGHVHRERRQVAQRWQSVSARVGDTDIIFRVHGPIPGGHGGAASGRWDHQPLAPNCQQAGALPHSNQAREGGPRRRGRE